MLAAELEVRQVSVAALFQRALELQALRPAAEAQAEAARVKTLCHHGSMATSPYDDSKCKSLNTRCQLPGLGLAESDSPAIVIYVSW